MFDSRDTRFPRSPDREFSEFVIEYLRSGKDPYGTLAYLDDIVSENRYTNNDFDDLIERVFAVAEFLFQSSRTFRDVGEATLGVLIIYSYWLAMEDRAGFLDRLSDRDYAEVRNGAEQFEAARREMGRGRGRGRDDRRDDRDRRGGRNRRDDRDDRDYDRDRRRSFRSDGSMHPDDVREERRRDARREMARRDDRDDRRGGRAREDEPRRQEERRPTARAKSALNKFERMNESERKRQLGTWRMNIYKARREAGIDQGAGVTEAELNAIGIDPEAFVIVGGELVPEQTAAEVKPAPAPERPVLREQPVRQAAASIPEPVAFTEVFEESRQAPRHARDVTPMTPAEEAALLPQVESGIDYNSAITSNGVVYSKDAQRPAGDPKVPTFKQYADAGFPITEPEFIRTLPKLPPVRGYAEHLPALYEAAKWVPTISATADGYQKLEFRERNVNKDDIMIPNFGKYRRTQRVPNTLEKAVEKSTRFNALNVATEEKAAIMRHDEATREWVAAGSDPQTAPLPEHVDTARHGQLVELPQTIHATSLSDAIVKMHTTLAVLGVGLDETANISANVEIHQLMGVVAGDDEWAIACKHLSAFERNNQETAHLMLPHLWQEFVSAKGNVPEAIWIKLNIYFTDVINEVLANNICIPMRIDSFEANGRQLLDEIASEHGRYMSETVSLHCAEVSRRLRCLSFTPDENIGEVPQSIWVVEPHRVVYANTMLNELGLAVFEYGGRDATPDRNRVTHYVVRPEQNEALVGIVERLRLDAAGNNKLNDVVIDLVTLDNYSASLHQNWLSQSTYLTLALSHL